MKRFALFAIFAFSCVCACSEDGKPALQTATTVSSSRIGASAVWQPPADFVGKAQTTCSQGAGPRSFGICFVDQMSAAGAPADAVSFTRTLYAQTKGQVGIMSAFKKVGPVDVAQVFYPLRANDNYGLLLVNGDPSILDVDDFEKLDRKGMEADSFFQAIKHRYPQTDIWPADRSGSVPWPRVQPLPGAGTQFIVSYPLINGCHACQHVGLARFGWDFDAAGKFLRTVYVSTPPPPRILHPSRTPPATEQQPQTPATQQKPQ